MVTAILATATVEETARLVRDGPRRDFLELATCLGGTVAYSHKDGSRRAILNKVTGGHVRQAWEAARNAHPADALFADGEHVGIPLACFLAVRGKRRSVKLTMLGHFVSKPWKVFAVRLACLAFPHATLLLHSTRQVQKIPPGVRRRWRVEAVPYHVDTEFWKPSRKPRGGRLVLAVGSEGRDYECLAEAAHDVDAEFIIAAGSHWARRMASASAYPSNVRYLSSPLTFVELRELYERATMLVVPLQELANQSGVTAVLEAMSMALPVVVTANEGQREVVSGPLVRADGALDWDATKDRGPALLGAPEADVATGVYVPARSPGSLAAAIRLLLDDEPLRTQMGRAGRCVAIRWFDTSHFVTRLANEIRGERAV